MSEIYNTAILVCCKIEKAKVRGRIFKNQIRYIIE